MPNYQLSSIRNYAEKYNVTPATISHALSVLEQKGLICNLRTGRYRICADIKFKKQEIVKQEVYNLFQKLYGLGFKDNEIMQMFMNQ